MAPKRVGDCNQLLTCSSTVTCGPKTEPKVTVIGSPETEPKVAKNFKSKKSIPIQISLSKNDNIQIHQHIEMSQDLNPSTCSSLVIFIYCACENRTFNATPSAKLQQHPLLVSARSFCEGCTWHHLHILVKALLFSDWKGQAATSKSPHRAHLISACSFAPHGCSSSGTSPLW